MKIKTIKIHNYRAFYPQHNENQSPKPYEIAVNSKNVLIYGENGSGKTSLFRAVRDFIASSRTQVQFDLHAFATPNADGSIQGGEISLEFDNGDIFKFTNHASLNDANRSSNISLADKASGWLTYSEILKTYLVDKNRPDLFDILVKQILVNHLLPPSSAITVGEEWASLESHINARRNSSSVKSVLKGGVLNCDTFNNGLKILLKGHTDAEGNKIVGIETILNKWLKDFFNNGIEISFNFQEVIEKTNDSKKINKRELNRALTLDINLNGRLIPKNDYQNFLNEARLSALAICIFLAAYKTYPSDGVPTKIIYLDDVFIGLDTSNRLPLLDILKKEFISDGYQIFVSTYDRAWFELAQKYLPEWCAIEMFVGENEHPVVMPNKGNFERAEAYFKAKDYPAAGNYLRKEVERLIIDRLPVSHIYDSRGVLLTELERLIDQLIKYYTECRCEFPVNLQKSLKMFKDIVLNPSSHYDLRSPLYKVEIEKAIEVVKQLTQLPIIKRDLLLGIGSSLFYRDGATIYEAEYILTENIYKITISNEVIITDAEHKLIRFTHQGSTKNKSDDQGIKLSERVAKIEHFLSLNCGAVNWEKDFKTAQNKSLIDL